MSHAASITLVGRAGTDPQLSSGLTGDRVSLRVVATERRFDRGIQEWVDGDEFGVSVVCWKALATAVLGTVRRGDPVIVCGRIATRRFDKDGVTQYFTEIKADAIGLDVAKVGGRIARRTTGSWAPGGAAAESREEAVIDQEATDQGAANRGAAEAAPADPDEALPPERYADEDPWGLRDTASVERGGELVGSG